MKDVFEELDITCTVLWYDSDCYENGCHRFGNIAPYLAIMLESHKPDFPRMTKMSAARPTHREQMIYIILTLGRYRYHANKNHSGNTIGAKGQGFLVFVFAFAYASVQVGSSEQWSDQGSVWVSYNPHRSETQKVMTNGTNEECWARKKVSMAGTSNYTPQHLWGVITHPGPWYLLLAQHSWNVSQNNHP